MAEALINLLIVLIVIGVIWYIGTIVLGYIPSPIPLLMIWNIIMALIVFIILLKFVLIPILGTGLRPI